MPVGILTNVLSVLAGSCLGSLLAGRLSRRLHESFPILFGYCAMAIGIHSIVKARSMTAVVLAVLIGFSTGHQLRLEERTREMLHRFIKPLCRGERDMDMALYVTVVALFCFSGFGWYGVLIESVSGNAEVLFSKAVLDFFTALLFAAVLGRAVCLIPFAQLVVMLALFGVGRLAAGCFTASALADLSACGGILTLAAGLRIARIKSVGLIDLMPALVLILPLSMLWSGIFQ